jgi:hypothetical protein
MSARLTITDPLVLGPDQLYPDQDAGTDVPEDDYDEWDISIAYALSDRVIFNHVIYESALTSDTSGNPNIGKQPDLNVGSWWLRVSPTNRWKAFEASHTTATAQAGGFWYEFKPGRAINAIHVTDMGDCRTLRITLTDPDAGVVWDTGEIAVGRVITSPSWWQWCFGRRVPVTQKHWYGQPAYPNAVLRIEVTGGADCAVGCVMVGQTTGFGLGVNVGLRLGIDDYSKKERDPWGAEQLKKGAYSQRISLALPIQNTELDALHDFLTQRRARVLFWHASGRWNATGVIGFYKNWDILISYATYSDVSIDLEGMQTL